MNVGSAFIEAFNARSEAEGWDLQCWPCATFDNPLLLALHDVWLQTAAGRRAPAKSDFSVRALAPHLRYLVFIDREGGDPHRYRLRFFGSILAMITGDHTGKYLDDVVPPSGVTAWTTLYSLVIGEALPVRVLSNSLLSGLDHLRAEAYLAPLMAKDDLPHGLMGACVFGPR